MAEAATEETADGQTTVPPMFTPLTLRDMTVANRVVMSPMCMYTADDGTVNDFHLVHLGSRAMGGSGLVITEMANVSREGRISPGCSGMYKDEHVAAWKRVVDFIHTHTDAKIGAQIAHAGRKGAQARTPEGRNRIMTDDAWPLLAPSPIPFGNDCQVPKEMDADDLEKLRGDFAAAARRAEQAGFDMVELHCGHGYLLSSFVSPLSNRRSDNYGGSLEARMRLPLEIFRAVREVWSEHKPMSMRISACDWMDGGITGDDSVEMAKMLKDAGLDIIDVSTGNVVPGARPTEGGMFQTPFSDRIRNEVGIPTMTVGNITSAEAVNDIIKDGRADLCCLAKGHLYDPYFTRHAARELGYDGLKWPMQYAAAAGFTPG